MLRQLDALHVPTIAKTDSNTMFRSVKAKVEVRHS